MDPLAALMLQIEWGADEAVGVEPINRLDAFLSGAPEPPPRPSPPPAAQAARGLLVGARAAAAAAAAETVEALRNALAAFDGCALRDTAANLVFAEGNPGSGLMLIGDAPSEHEERAGRPFAGPAGAYLDRMLASVGLDRSKALLAMLVPWRPPGGRPPSDAEIAACLPFLLRHVVLVRPRRLVLLGSTVANELLRPNAGHRRLLRGAWLDVAVPGLPAPIPALLMASPGAVLGKPPERRRAWADLRLLRRTIDAELSNS